MKCPACTDQDLLMTDRQGIEIDYCPKCRGVWLDRGELDKIIERSAKVERDDDDDDDDDRRRRAYPPQGQPQGQGYGYPAPPPPPPSSYRRDDDDYKHHKHHKRKSFWSELFD